MIVKMKYMFNRYFVTVPSLSDNKAKHKKITYETTHFHIIGCHVNPEYAKISLET